MKNLLILVAVLGLAACSSKSKNDGKELVKKAENVQADSAQAKADLEKAQKEAEEAAKNAADEAQAASASVDASYGQDFGPYEGTEKSKITCKSGDSVRTVAVLTSDKGCGVVYNKGGADKTIAIANYQLDHCDTVQSKVKANLEAGGYTCQ